MEAYLQISHSKLIVVSKAWVYSITGPQLLASSLRENEFHDASLAKAKLSRVKYLSPHTNLCEYKNHPNVTESTYI
jgi:hypothetical protein